METNEIVVGTDGSGWSAAAVRWAAREAHRRAAPMRIVMAYDTGWPGPRRTASTESREIGNDRAEAMVKAAALQVREAAPSVAVRHEAVAGEPSAALLDAARHAAMLVVGNRGRGGFASLMLGSVSEKVATHAPCSVVVVRGQPDVSDGPVVVGVNGSPSSTDVLGTAFEFAAEHNCRVLAVRAYEPLSPPWGPDVEPIVPDAQEREAAEREALGESLAPWREKYPTVEVEALVAHGNAARVLVGASHTAQLVVVGSRGHGSVTGTLLSSVGLQLLRHADCPVLIARGTAS